MSEAPEKIWVFKNGFLKGWSSHGEGHLTTEYTRSDISQTRIDKANDKTRKISQVLDNQLGTPCESIRHAQEIEELQAEVSRLKAVLEGIAQFKFYDGFPTPEAGRASAALEYGEVECTLR